VKLLCLLSLSCLGALASGLTQPRFLARRDYPSAPGYVAVADVNGDGIPDVVSSSGTGVHTLLGNGNGTFRVGPTTNPGGVLGGQIVAIDLNGDGFADLIIPLGDGIEVCFGNGDGTFQSGVLYGPGGGQYLTVGDFNGDGVTDVAVPSDGGVYLFLGKGGGVFSTGVLIPVSSTTDGNLAAADLNGDGNLDLAVALRHTPNDGFAVLFGNGDGTFQSPVYHSGPSSTWVATSDLTGNGHTDVVITAGGTAYIYLNNGHGIFSAPSTTPLPGPEFAIGDVNRDGIPDLVSDQGYVAIGVGNATFAPLVYYPVEGTDLGDNYFNVVLADLHKNGVTDIVAGEQGATSVLLNTGKGAFSDGEFTSVPGSGNCAAAADFNGDGKPDLAVPTTAGVVILLGTGKASAPYTTGTTIPLSGPGCPISGDVNGDGIPDILLGANSLGGVGVYLGNGAGTFALASVIPVGPATNLVLGDFNGDGIMDFADSSNELAIGNGDGTFQPPVPIIANPPTGFGWIAAGDVNNDGYTDLLATEDINSVPGAGFYVLLNNKTGSFTLTTVKDGRFPFSIMLADLDGDGNLDAVNTEFGLGTASVYLGNGQGGFNLIQKNIPFPFGDGNVFPAQIGDVNGDGIPDLLLPSTDSITIALGTGKGTFLTGPTVGAGPGEGQILLESLHGRSTGFPDLVAPDASGGVWVLLNFTK